jgi:cbb3-type cytochrome oxidase subunit 1
MHLNALCCHYSFLNLIGILCYLSQCSKVSSHLQGNLALFHFLSYIVDVVTLLMEKFYLSQLKQM